MTQAAIQTESFISSSPPEIESIAVRPGHRGAEIDEAIRKHIEPATRIGLSRITMGQVFYLLDSNKAQLFLAIQEDEIVAVVITEVVEFVSGARCLKVILCGGKGAMSGGMGGMIDKVEEFAMLALCSTIQVEGRKGWERALPDDYRYSYTVFEKEMF